MVHFDRNINIDDFRLANYRKNKRIYISESNKLEKALEPCAYSTSGGYRRLLYVV